VCRRASSALLCGLLLAACVACGGDNGGEQFAIYHMETSIGPPRDEGELRCGPPRAECPGVLRRPPPQVYRYAVRAAPAVTGDDIERESVRRSTDPATGAPVLSIALTPDGRRAFARLTKEVARTGGRDQGWHHLAVVVGDEIVAFPEIDFDVYPDGFPDAPGIQFPAASDADARELVERLRGG
jgi:preprotein translocase subunit SecD